MAYPERKDAEKSEGRSVLCAAVPPSGALGTASGQEACRQRDVTGGHVRRCRGQLDWPPPCSGVMAEL